jgi:hypothetical protein
MRLVIVLLFILTPIQSPTPSIASSHPADLQREQNPSQSVVAKPVPSVEGNKPSENHQSANSSESMPYLLLTGVIALATVAQAVFAFIQRREFQRQYKIMSDALVSSNVSAEAANKSAEAASKGIVALEKMERPFLMIEVRGTFNNQVWLVNKGRIPAQIVWHNPSGSILFPDFQFEELPAEANYGFGYDDPHMEEINVPWIAPGAEMELASYSLVLAQELGEKLRSELNVGTKCALFFSSVKYRGMLNDTIFESRWCFRWLGQNRGLRPAGPYGYNKYT